MMALNDKTILLAMAALLATCLCGWRWRRLRHGPPEHQWPGHGIDVTALSQRVHRLRGDYLAEAQSRPQLACRRKGLLASARQAVGRLSYFRRRAAQSSSDKEYETSFVP